jgi:hypothetical protein
VSRLDRWEERLRPAALPLGALVLLVVIVVLGVRALREPELGDTRFYREGARLFMEGENLYLLEPPFDRSRYNPNTGYTYPPPFAAVSVWMLALPYPAVRVLWLLAMSACMALSAWVAWKLAAQGRAPPRRPLLLAALTALLVGRFALNDLAHGQVNWLVTALLLGALLGAERERPLPAGVALGLALAIKPTSWLLLPFFLVARRDLRLVAACALTLVAVLALPGIRYGTDYPRLCGDWFLLMERFADENTVHPGNASLAAALARLGHGSHEDQVVRLLFSFSRAGVQPVARALAVTVVGAGFGWVCWKLPRARSGPAAVLVLGALLSPITWKAHLVVLILPAILLAWRASERLDRGSLALLSGLAALLLLPSRGLLGLGLLEAYGSLTLALLVLFVSLIGLRGELASE